MPGKLAGPRRTTARFERLQAALKFPLLLRLVALAEKRGARRGGFVRSGDIAPARRDHAGIGAAVVPQASAAEEAVVEAVAHKLLEIRVGESVGLDCADIFTGEVDARDPFVVRAQRHRHTEFAVGGKGCSLPTIPKIR
jgi:hypothetical protein